MLGAILEFYRSLSISARRELSFLLCKTESLIVIYLWIRRVFGSSDDECDSVIPHILFSSSSWAFSSSGIVFVTLDVDSGCNP